MITFKVSMTPSNPAQRVRQMKTSLERRRELMQLAKEYMITRWNANFASNGSIYGAWAGNSSWKEGEGTLHGATGALANYFNAANEAGIVTDEMVSWHFQNDDSQYSVTHSTSGISPNPLPNHKPIPQRIIWDMNAEDRQQLVRMTERWVESKVAF